MADIDDPLLLADSICAEMGRLDELARIRSAIGILTVKERELTEAHEQYGLVFVD